MKRQTKFVFPRLFFIPEFNWDLGANFTSEFKLSMAHSIFSVLPPFVSELLTFNADSLLNDDSDDEVGEILGVLLEKNVIPKIQNYVETVVPSLPDVFTQTAARITMM